MSGRFKKKEKEEDGEPDYPKLNASQLQEITELYIKFGKKRDRLLKYWNAINVDSEGRMTTICDFSDWYAKSDENKKKYEAYQPIKGIWYTGHGFHTTMPYFWCQAWLSTWEEWIRRQADRGDRQALELISKEVFHR